MIRVLRIMEYEYEDNERAKQDMARWQIPANGSKRQGGMVIRSAIIIDLNSQPTKDEI
jgi:hypothetical protein